MLGCRNTDDIASVLVILIYTGTLECEGYIAAYTINAISGLTANDKGRYITLEGTGTDKAATIADSASFTLEDGATWTAKAGSSITFRVMDPATLVEVQGTRVQTA